MKGKSQSYKVYLTVFTLLFFAMSISSGKSSAQEDWPQLCKDAQHTGFTSSFAPNESKVLWTFNTSGPVISSPAIANGKVYFGSNDGWVYSLKLDTGELIWKYETDGPVESSPTIADEILYIGSDDSNLYAINANTGFKIWNFSTNDRIGASPTFWSGMILIGSYDFTFYAINTTGGWEEWNHSTGYYVQGSAAVWDEMVLMGGCDGILRSLHVYNGQVIWEFDSGNYIAASPSIYNGKVYLYGSVGSLFEKDEAEDAVSRMKGVVEVENNLKIDKEPAIKTDWEIKRDIERQLFWNPFVDSDDIRVAVKDGVATLTGSVYTWYQLKDVMKNALEGGARWIINRLDVKHGPHDYTPRKGPDM